MSIFVAGVDLGEVNDFTAVILMEVTGTQRTASFPDGLLPFEGLPVTRYAIRHIERFNGKDAAMVQGYGPMARHIRQQLFNMHLPVCVGIDGAGVGRAATEYFRELNPTYIVTTGGFKVRTETDGSGREWHYVPKRDLIRPLQAASQNKIVKVATGLAHADSLLKELKSYRVTISNAGNDTYEAQRQGGAHDDLVWAGAAAAYMAEVALAGNHQAIQERIAQAQADELYQQTRISLF